MKKDTELWLQYAEENLKSARVLLESALYNPSLQNSQQAVEDFIGIGIHVCLVPGGSNDKSGDRSGAY